MRQVGTLVKWVLKPAAWGFYFLVVFEILFMISPVALHYYSVYGPVLNSFHRSPATSWLTQFYLPHFSRTGGVVLDSIPMVSRVLILAGVGFFLAAAIPLYKSRILRRGAMIAGPYRYIRHPQYVALAILGLGTSLLWPRFFVLVSYVTMVFLYLVLARWEEDQCLRRFGESYRAYQESTGMFLPRRVEDRLPRLIPARGLARLLIGMMMYVGLIASTLALGFALRDHSLSRISALYLEDAVVISPAVLAHEELETVYEIALSDAEVKERMLMAGARKRILYVVPAKWYLPDLPMEAEFRPGGHRTPSDFDRSRFKVLVTAARIHDRDATGRDIVKSAYGRVPIAIVRVDASTRQVLAVETPPPHVHWGDIPTPMF
ncbi:MAG: isoprenylcysteine carboxylmethyltransferase family protein [Planctomycetota bacterium]|nr:isoprenylcysteine carboxylmethyltransferase family protein [Planctomycetota bacterium]